MSKLNHETRFEISKEINERLLKLEPVLAKGKNDLARSLMLLGLEVIEGKLVEGCQVLFVPLPNTKIQSIRLEEPNRKGKV